MKALRALRGLKTLSPRTHNPHLTSVSICRFYAAQPQQENPTNTVEDDNDAVFDSGHYSLPNIASDSAPKIPPQPTWDEAYRAKADRTIFGTVTQKQSSRTVQVEVEVEEEEERRRATMLAKALLQAALEKPDDVEEEDMVVKEEDQRSLSVGIIGAPNAGKSALTNFMVRCLFCSFFAIGDELKPDHCDVGTKVAAVSRKTNTTTHEVLGVMTKGNTQIVCFLY
ncbi:hypothetical protein HHK36_023174 [Tetracentron sinense]|uniref:G domain-containing protein n=1 Tax=Tetracentron sinense TaxID=13715 RepID=A0A834YMM5_TETSI|nr:hypothetical protein HHK36_023174 [Tetracentron sinense]